MPINNKSDAANDAIDGYLARIPTNTDNEIKASSFHNYLASLLDWIFPSGNADGSTIVAKNGYEISWDIMMPIGGIIPYAGLTAPNGWLGCDGQEYLISQYTDLFNVIGTIYNNGTTTTNGFFRVPNIKGKVLVGAGQQDLGVGARETESPTYNLGDFGGVNKYAFNVDEMASHDHGGGNHNHNVNGGRFNGASGLAFINQVETHKGTDNGQVELNLNNTAALPQSGNIINSNGGNIPHENRMPHVTTNYIIKI